MILRTYKDRYLVKEGFFENSYVVSTNIANNANNLSWGAATSPVPSLFEEFTGYNDFKLIVNALPTDNTYKAFITATNGYSFGMSYSGATIYFRYFDGETLQTVNSQYVGAGFQCVHCYLIVSYCDGGDYNGNKGITWVLERSNGFIVIGSWSAATNSFVAQFIENAELPADPYGTQNNETPSGGWPNFDYSGDDVDIPALPSISAAASGFVRLYNPTITEVQGLANYLWSGAFDIATYKKLFGNPMDCFLSFGIIPVIPPRGVNKEAISFANMPDPGVTAYKITDQFTDLDCGTVTIDGSKYTGSAMDYSPYTKAELFLPFCGTHALAVDDIMDSTINITYHMDLYTGA